MKTTLTRPLAGFTIGLLAAVLVACNGSSDAGTSGVSQAAFNQLKAQVADQADAITALQKQVESLQSGSSDALKAKLSHLYVTIAAPNAQGVSRDTQSYGDSSSGIQTMAVADTCSGLGTLTGHPSNSDPRISSKLAGKSCSGYIYNINASIDGGYSHVLPLPQGVWYDGPNCTGTGYIDDGISILAQQGGLVFSLNRAAGNIDDPSDDDWGNAAYYKMVPPGSAPVTFIPASYYTTSDSDEFDGKNLDGTWHCEPLMSGGGQFKGYTFQPNDPATTDIPSGLIPGPVGMGTIQ